jgi:hypothetical protein
MSQYGCHNKPRPTAGARLAVQDGWHDLSNGLSRYPNMVTTPFVMSADCQYTQQHARDPQCVGCAHRAKESA